eukprot:TRINITY_DN57360_c0_g1_i1.p1 TRINITY_DN57360_c0_g1~~TRINITY_DN57360_c0_g1_i1.p1  ORF type:complete len:363 (+),score=61.95 TRINITY_DN57360_c0_g1_i1:58-1089(+)
MKLWSRQLPFLATVLYQCCAKEHGDEVQASVCFPIPLQVGQIVSKLQRDLCCPYGGWALCWAVSGFSHEACCSGAEAEDSDWEVVAVRRASHLARLQASTAGEQALLMSPAGFLERSHRFSALFLARLLESYYGRESRSVSVVEVGVQRGRFAHTLLSALWDSPGIEFRARRHRKRHALSMPQRLRLPSMTAAGPGSLKGRVQYTAVDLWQHQDADYNESANVASHTQVANMRAVMDLLAPFWPAVRITQQPSALAARLFDQGMVDLVYIDARHDFASVLEDLQVWWPLVRDGGFLAGDDFTWPNVSKAVWSFSETIGIKPLGLGSGGSDFLFIRPLGHARPG